MKQEQQQSSSPSLEGLISKWEKDLERKEYVLIRDISDEMKMVILSETFLLKLILSDLRQLPSIKEGWIDVKKEFPKLPPPYVEDGTTFTPVTAMVLATNGEYVFEASHNGEHFYSSDVTHWQPLPSPPAKQL